MRHLNNGTDHRHSKSCCDQSSPARRTIIHRNHAYSYVSSSSSRIHDCLCRIIRAPWWRHQMETFSALLALCEENSPVPGEFPAQRPVTRSFEVFFDLRLNKRLSKQWWGWWFETLSRPFWRHRNDRNIYFYMTSRHKICLINSSAEGNFSCKLTHIFQTMLKLGVRMPPESKQYTTLLYCTSLVCTF